jgi:phage-related protein
LTIIPEQVYTAGMEMKLVQWIASSNRDIRVMPESVRRTFGFALYLAQQGQKHEQAKPMRGFGSAGVLEVVEDDRSGTYRAVYTVRFSKAIYVLHCFQKKSTSGVATSQQDIELIRHRLMMAEQHSKENDYV